MRNCWAPCTLKEATPFITKPICSALTMFRYTDIMAVVMRMSINEIIDRSGMTKYRIAKLSGIPHATLNDLCSGKTHIEKCSGETLYRGCKNRKVIESNNRVTGLICVCRSDRSFASMRLEEENTLPVMLARCF